MSYQAPVFVEVKMDAEIGSYQQDDRGPSDEPAFVQLESASEAE